MSSKNLKNELKSDSIDDYLSNLFKKYKKHSPNKENESHNKKQKNISKHKRIISEGNIFSSYRKEGSISIKGICHNNKNKNNRDEDVILGSIIPIRKGINERENKLYGDIKSDEYILCEKEKKEERELPKPKIISLSPVNANRRNIESISKINKEIIFFTPREKDVKGGGFVSNTTPKYNTNKFKLLNINSHEIEGENQLTIPSTDKKLSLIQKFMHSNIPPRKGSNGQTEYTGFHSARNSKCPIRLWKY